MPEYTELEKLYEIAHDNELEVLDDLAVRAGLRWRCPDGWINFPGEACECCGRYQGQRKNT